MIIEKIKCASLLVLTSLIFHQCESNVSKDVTTKPKQLNEANLTDSIEIIVAPVDYNFIDSLRKDVLTNRVITKGHKVYRNATILFENDSIPVKIRLKGDRRDHYSSNPPSFRVKIKGNKTLFGTNKLSIQSLDTRNSYAEWIYLKILEEQDILSLNMGLIHLTLNEHEKLYSYEEHFTHYLTQRFGRPNGPIICITEDAFWERLSLDKNLPKKEEFEIYKKSPIKSFKNKAKLDIDVVFNAQYLLESYQKGEKKASEVFDIEKLSLAYAIADLVNAHHSLRWHNNRFYFNPKTKKLEPIGFDGMSRSETNKFVFEDIDFLNPHVVNQLFSDEIFVQKYVEALDFVSQEQFLNQFFKSNKETLLNLQNEIKKSDSTYQFNHHKLINNAKWIKDHLPEYSKKLNHFIQTR